MAGLRPHQARVFLKELGVRVRLYNVKMIKLGTVIVLNPRVSRTRGPWELRHQTLMDEARAKLEPLGLRISVGNSQLYIGVPDENTTRNPAL